jgi:hypothetical protein
MEIFNRRKKKDVGYFDIVSSVLLLSEEGTEKVKKKIDWTWE